MRWLNQCNGRQDYRDVVPSSVAVQCDSGKTTNVCRQWMRSCYVTNIPHIAVDPRHNSMPKNLDIFLFGRCSRKVPTLGGRTA